MVSTTVRLPYCRHSQCCADWDCRSSASNREHWATGKVVVLLKKQLYRCYALSLMPFMNFLHQCPCILVSSPSACVKLQMQSSCTGEDTSGAYSGAIHPRATYLGSCLHCAGDTERLMLLVFAFLDIEAVLCNL